MGRPKKIRAYDIPDNVLNVLNEHCHRGFLLFTYDNLDQLRLFCNFDDPIVMKSLKSDVCNWMNAMNHVETQATLQGILGQNYNPDDNNNS